MSAEAGAIRLMQPEIATRVSSGAGGGNRTHGLGIMRPSLYH
jgi:hypothetical protein